MIDVMTHWGRLGHIRHKVQGHSNRDKKRRKSTDVAHTWLDRYSYAFFSCAFFLCEKRIEEKRRDLRTTNKTIYFPIYTMFAHHATTFFSRRDH